MADYIERQAIYKKISEMEESARNRYLDTPWDSPARNRYMAQLNERTALKHMIADEPAANVREDVQGEWEWFDEEHGTPIDGWDREWGWRCSCCKDTLNDEYDDPDSSPKFNFCPNCGARMDGGGEQ